MNFIAALIEWKWSELEYVYPLIKVNGSSSSTALSLSTSISLPYILPFELNKEDRSIFELISICAVGDLPSMLLPKKY